MGCSSLFASLTAFVAILCCIELPDIHPVFAQPGFLSLDCGLEASNNYTDNNGIIWVSDASYLQHSPTLSLSQTTIVNATPSVLLVNQVALSTLRYFPGGEAYQSKYCYQVGGLVQGQYYLIRASFFHPNYTASNFSFSVDTQAWPIVITRPNSPSFKELYAPAGNKPMRICLIKTDSASNPFISSLELRRLDNNMATIEFLQGNGITGDIYYHINYGESSAAGTIRYPSDAYDRIWYPRLGDGDAPRTVTNETINNRGTLDFAPLSVLQTAFGGGNHSSIQDILDITSESQLIFIMLHFAEIGNVTSPKQRVFEVYVNNVSIMSDFDVFSSAGNQALRGGAQSLKNGFRMSSFLNLTCVQESGSLFPPIISAIEVIRLSDGPFSLGTFSDDVSVIEDLQNMFGLNNWTGDPCLPFRFKWLNCSSENPPRITSLILSNLNLSGSIPASLNKLTEVQTILLDGNALTGSIPDLRDLSNLQTLDLRNNLLNGSIPNSMGSLQRLSALFLQNNNFSGLIPKRLLQKKGYSMLLLNYEGNRYLCEPGNTTCIALGTFTAERNAVPGYIIGIIAAAVILFVSGSIIFLVRKCKRNSTGPDQATLPFKNLGSSYEDLDEPAMSLSRLFKYHEIEVATGNFCKELGRGASGIVYLGRLLSGQDIGVKLLSLESCEGTVDQFTNEVNLLSRIHHKNLLLLLGYCTTKKLALVYEYIPGGTLGERLYGSRSANPLSWKERLVIAIGAAEGLDYLHTMCSPPIIHRDVKSDNILLDEHSMAKVADFGISRSKRSDTATHVSTIVIGTPGYLDPEYFTTSQLTEESDVYSFGVVLLEIICAMPPYILKAPEQNMHIVEWVRQNAELGKMEDVMDPALKQHSHCNLDSVWTVAQIGLQSTQIRRNMRPSMSKVVSELKYALKLELKTNVPLSN